MERHTFPTVWEVFTPTLEDVVVMFCLPLFRVSNKSTYTSLIQYFREGDGGGPAILLAIVVHRPKRPGGWHKHVRLSPGYPLAKGKKLALGPLYHGSLYLRLDECVNNILQSYDAATWLGTLRRASYGFSFSKDLGASLLG